MDNAWLLKPLEVRGGSGGNKHQPYATRTYFGWSVNGPISAGKSRNVGSCFASSIEADVERLWMMENECEDRAPSQNDQKVINLWDKETRYEDGHYVLPIPWRGEPNLPNNRDVAERRLRSLNQRLVKSGILNVYSENISDLLKKGYAEYVPEVDLKRDDGKMWFRQHHYAITADIEAMYHQIKIPISDRDALRFLWYVSDKSINEQDRAKEAKELTSNMHSKVLGIKWDFENDCFFFVSKGVQTQNVIRRVMLSQLASTYDPLGLILPIIVPAEILFQEATRHKISWDESIPVSLCQKWLKWIASLYEISRLRFPRCVLPLELNGCTSELHHFCDASEVAFGACTYIRTINQDGKVHTPLLVTNARVAPIKGITIPRLEISAAVEAAKLDAVVRRELDIPLLKSNFWSDSTIVLAYIQNETRRFKTFVANRVTLIRQVSEANQWHHVSGEDNPADVLSRGCFVDNLPVSWFNGPPFLSNYKCA
ncbi:uncharacterized protein LOC143034111 [Oratosquilla oratoria]|uniref:uncharacterized protein LOC143034111 n=1 Tax=Oratosquilla oratoria TaxID=337810 RepID=UPI003F773FBC